jgi:hypothetical protein
MREKCCLPPIRNGLVIAESNRTDSYTAYSVDNASSSAMSIHKYQQVIQKTSVGDSLVDIVCPKMIATIVDLTCREEVHTINRVRYELDFHGLRPTTISKIRSLRISEIGNHFGHDKAVFALDNFSEYVGHHLLVFTVVVELLLVVGSSAPIIGAITAAFPPEPTAVLTTC